MQQTKQALNTNLRTGNDERNNEARLHEGHDLHILRSKHVAHPMTPGYDVLDVICETCKKQYKACVWTEK